VARGAGDGKLASNWVMTEVMRLLNDGDGELDNLKITATSLGAMLRLIASDAISGKIGKTVFEEMAATGKPATIIAEKVSDFERGAIEEHRSETIAAHPGPVGEYLKGKEATFQFLVGMAMKASRGRAKPDALRERLREALERMKTS
jgi:aspartyl-tRNA(Asn)/glutamyl-tRNA(Gln) amidotransferase subunit B